MRTIGILGGMGPEATILLQRRVLAAVPAMDDAHHVPLMIDMNTQVPSRIAHLIEGTGPDPAPTLAAMAARLQAAGAAALAMPCNTAHHYASAITGAVDIPFLDVIDLAADYAARALGRGGRVGVLGSPATRSTALFDKRLGAKGLSVLWPEDEVAVLGAIRSIKANGATDAARTEMRKASSELHAAGAELQMVACSEFSLIADEVKDGVQSVDTLDLLAHEIARFAQHKGPISNP